MEMVVVPGDDDAPFVVLGEVTEDRADHRDDIGAERTLVEQVPYDEKPVDVPLDHEPDDPLERLDKVLTPFVPFLATKSCELRTNM